MRYLRGSSMRKIVLPRIALLCLSCAAPSSTSSTKPAPKSDPNTLESLHVRLTINPADGSVVYFGWYDGRRNLLGAGGIVAALVGMEPPELSGELKRLNATELRYDGVDQNQIA